jgi:hypothetical protein
MLQYRHKPSRDVLKDVFDGKYMKRIVGEHRISNTGLHVIWALGADGVVAREMDAYSVTPIFMTCLIFDPEFRYSWEALVCVGIVPGPGHNTLEPFLRPILEDIAKPFKTRDVLTGAEILVHQSLAIAVYSPTYYLSPSCFQCVCHVQVATLDG